MTYQLRLTDLERLHRFQTRTVVASSNHIKRPAYSNGIIPLVSQVICPDGFERLDKYLKVAQHPYLMHVVMTLTAMHDRFLANFDNTEPSLVERFHWIRATGMFRQKLSTNIRVEDKDPIFATCALLKGICLALVEAATPLQSWPFADNGTLPLEWMRLQDGVHAIYELVHPLPPGSAFNSLVERVAGRDSVFPVPTSGTFGLNHAWIELFGLDEDSNHIDHPYHGAVRIVTDLLGIECNKSTIFEFFRFSANPNAEFRRLMYRKDPRAILLLAYWYAMVCDSFWFIQRRATTECQAICMYLERYHGGDDLLQSILDFPKQKMVFRVTQPNTLC